MEERCPNYCGRACIDGSCPIANRDEYQERGYHVVWSCDDCHYYDGCKDCCFCGEDGKCDIDNKLKMKGK